MRNRLSLVAFLVGACLAACLPASAQQKNVTVTGTVVDDSGQPVVGAAVMVKRHNALGGQVTDLDGRFTFTVPAGSVLSVSCIGYETVEYKAAATGSPRILMPEDAILLDDAVVVGYGVQQKESVVGSIAQVSTDKLVNSGTTNISNALAGKLSGVQTFQTSGQPGSSDATIVIRGLSSWNGNTPLVMVDGIERSFSDLDPNEVKTISVLKDASATAVFGAKGANGVILVTTRTGSVGRPKMQVSVDTGINIPTDIPDHISSYETIQYANIAKRNMGSFTDQFSRAVMEEYRHPSSRLNTIRYPDNDFFQMVLRPFATNVNANFNISGGSDRVKYFVSAGYTHEGSIVRQIHEFENTTFQFDRINYRSNIDFKLTPSTDIALKVGGSIGIRQRPTGIDDMSVNDLFTYMYTASPLMYPAYFPGWMLEEVPDPEAPGDTGYRISSKSSGLYPAYYPNPYQAFSTGSFDQRTTSKLDTDLILGQKLDFITPGLSLNGKVSLTTSFWRYSLTGTKSYPTYDFDWAAWDAGEGNPWKSSQTSSDIYVRPPYKATQNTVARDQQFLVYWEVSLNYARKFAKKHNVTGLVLFNRRENNVSASFPRRSEGLVARGTYDYAKKYLLEVNMGYTGSEQFSQSYRYGFFPSAALGYVVSNERFWKKAMPWWSKFKLRYSDGLVGSDKVANDLKWLYYASFTKQGNGTISEDRSANVDARWETAHKRDLGIEMGWIKDRIQFTVDLFDEHRKDMLITPVVTPLVGLSSMPVNRGAMKKHGIDFELSYRNTTATGFYYEFGGMLSLNENRITRYEDIPYNPDYQKYAGKAYNGQRNGIDLIDDGVFTTIDEIHGYPAFTTAWRSVYPGVLKYLDYTGDGIIDKDDLHAIDGSTYPPLIYSFNTEFEWKGFSFSVLLYGNHGKWVNFNKTFIKEFPKGDYLIHAAQTDFWTPDHRDATHPALAFNDEMMYAFAGGSVSGGYTAAVPGQTWRKADYLTLKELRIGYRIKGATVKRLLGVDSIVANVTANNLFTWTDLVEGNPQVTTFSSNFYPIMTTLKFGLKMTF